MDRPPPVPTVADLLELTSGRSGPTPLWTEQGTDLHVNVLVLARGEAIREHVNAELDVLLVVIEGTGSLTIDGAASRLHPGYAALIPKGARRGVRSTDDRLVYLTCHRRRALLWPDNAPRGG